MRCPVVFALSIPAVAASAQEVAYWNTLPLPGALTAPVVSFGSNVTLQTATQVYMYSGILRRWASVPVSPAATVSSQYNDFVVIRDGTTVHGWSTRTGTVATLTVSPSATVNPGTQASSWLAIVLDGTTAYGFAAFVGAWVPLTLSAPNPVVQMASTTMLLVDGPTAYGFSAFQGTWVPAPAGTPLLTQESVALTVDANDDVRGFSAFTNGWSTQRFPGAATAVQGNGRGYALLLQGNNALGFSAYRGSFTVYSGAQPLVTLTAGRDVALFQEPGLAVGYAPGVGTFNTQPISLATLQAASSFVGCYGLVADAGALLYAFSGISGRFTAPLPGSYSAILGDTCALLQGPTSWIYDVLNEQFIAVPAVNTTDVKPLYDGLVLVHQNGLEGFCSRTGTWTSLNVPPGIVQFHGSILGNLSGNRLDVFDSRLGRWVTLTGVVNLATSFFRLTCIAHDGFTAQGFSLFTNVPDSVTIQGSVQTARANSEIGYVLTNTHIHVFTAFGSLSPLFRFPEFSRVQPRGVPMRMMQQGNPGDVVVTLLSDRSAFLPAPGFGTLFLDPSRILSVFLLGTVGANGVLDTSLPIPADPALSGAALHLQNAVLPGTATPWLTNSIAPVLF